MSWDVSMDHIDFWFIVNNVSVKIRWDPMNKKLGKRMPWEVSCDIRRRTIATSMSPNKTNSRRLLLLLLDSKE